MTTDTKVLPVALDAMGGDHGCSVVVEGAVQAAKNLGIKIVIVGDESQILSSLRSLGAENLSINGESLITIFHAPDTIEMDDSPSAAIRGKPNSSIRKAFSLVKKGEASSIVSPGNTGAVMAAGLFVSGTLPGIVRPAIATLIPKMYEGKPVVMLDSGANVDCHAHQLVQFAIMGSYYAKMALGYDNPKVSLLSNGSEDSKGTDIIRAAAHQLSGMSTINYAGFIEGKDISKGKTDVVVMDGFVGNCMLKAMEGTVELVVESVKEALKDSLRGKLGILLAQPVLTKVFKQKLDPSSYGGAPLLGLKHVAIICHGSAKARAIMNAIRVASDLVSANIVDKLQESLLALDNSSADSCDDGPWDRVSSKEWFSKAGSKVRGKSPAE